MQYAKDFTDALQFMGAKASCLQADLTKWPRWWPESN